MVAMAVPEEDRFRAQRDEILRQDRGAARIEGRGRQLGTIDVAVEQDDASLHRDGVGGVRRPGEDDLPFVHPAPFIHVLDAEELLPGGDQRVVGFSIVSIFPVVVSFLGGGGQRKQAQRRQKRGKHSRAVHGEPSLFFSLRRGLGAILEKQE